MLSRRGVSSLGTVCTVFAASLLLMATAAAAGQTVVLKLVDQHGVEIPDSLIRVLGEDVPTGSSIELPLGTHSFEAVPAVLGMARPAGLVRDETREVSATTTEISFEWITSNVVLRLHDQHGVDIPGSWFRVAYYHIVAVPTGESATLPITDDGVYPTIRGIYGDGYQLGLNPAVFGRAPQDSLYRGEPAKVTAATTEFAFEWITSEVTLRLNDQSGVDIPGSWFQVANYHTVTIHTGDSATLPITDDTVYPTIGGTYGDGYRFSMNPAIFERAPQDSLNRWEPGRVTADTTGFAFEWITTDVTFRVVDQHGVDIPGSWFQIANYHIVTIHTGDSATLPITDDTTYPTIGGTYKDGLLVGFTVGLPVQHLARKRTLRVTADLTETTSEWLRFGCQVHVRDESDLVVAGSALGFPAGFPPRTHGDVVFFPVNDPATYPTLAGTYSSGYPILVTPGDIAPTSDTIAFRKLASGDWAPATFEIGGNTYRLACKLPDDEPPTLDPVPSHETLWPPDHRMVEVTIKANVESNSGDPVTLAAAVESSEGESSHEPDWEILEIDPEKGVIRLNLRAEREGTAPGRVYTITITATDSGGNQTEAVVTVTVPHDQGK